MKFLIQVIAIIIVGYLAETLLPWYSVAFVAFVFGYVLKSNANFLAGFIAVALLWFLKIHLIDTNAAVDMGAQVAQILPVKQKSILIIITVFIGALVGGFASLTGALLKGKKAKKARAGYY